MNLSALLRKRLLIVSGKGGVGKSTVVAALALLAARRGKRVLTVEIDTKERISQLFGAPEVGHAGRQIYENIWAMNVAPARVMDEFVETQVPLRMLTRQVLDSPIYQYFVAAAPGMKELVTLGKIMMLEEERAVPRARARAWDLIIVDAPATGHGVSFLRVPYLVCEALRVGPVVKQARKIVRLLTDKRRTRFLLVTLAEEMPVNEAIELFHLIDEELGIPLSHVIVNGVYPAVLKPRQREVLERLRERIAERATPGDDTPMVRAMVSCLFTADARRLLNEQHIKRLTETIPRPAVEVPFVFATSLDFDLVETVAVELERLLEGVQS